MTDNKTPELRLELSQGEFKLLADGIALHILVNPNGAAPSAMANGVASKPVTESSESRLLPGGEDPHYYREISNEIYREIGRLAKDLNVSLQDLSGTEIIDANLVSPGQSLGQAQDQLADVLQMTETATLDILELIEKIRDDCQEMQTALDELVPAELSEPAEPEAPGTEIQQLVAFYQDAQRLLPSLSTEAEALLTDLRVLEDSPPFAASPPPSEPAGAVGPATYQFSLEVILQTIYEFCTNETVKQHLKSFLGHRDTMFQAQPVKEALNRLAQTMEPEDNFFNFPVVQIFQILADACQDDQGRTLLKKMAASSSNIFLDSALPLEAQPLSADEASVDFPSLAAGEIPSEPPARGLTAQMAKFVEQLQQLAGQVPEILPEPEKIGLASSTRSQNSEAQDRIAQVVPLMQERLQRVNGSLSRILEALSFQDLSGQRMLKVLKMLRQLQVQILTILISFGTKIGQKDKQQELTVAESEILAQEEIDRLLTSVTIPPGIPGDQPPEALPEDGQPLDQGAVNELLASLGF